MTAAAGYRVRAEKANGRGGECNAITVEVPQPTLPSAPIYNKKCRRVLRHLRKTRC